LAVTISSVSSHEKHLKQYVQHLKQYVQHVTNNTQWWWLDLPVT
jgi:hypothetical protein